MMRQTDIFGFDAIVLKWRINGINVMKIDIIWSKMTLRDKKSKHGVMAKHAKTINMSKVCFMFLTVLHTYT